MARIDKVFDESTISQGSQVPLSDLRFGAQMGYSPDLTTWVSNHPYTRRNLICFLLEAPRALQKLPDGDKWIASFREFMERMPHTITGLQQSYDISTDSVRVGKSGEEQEFFTNVQVSKPEIQITMHERYGLAIYNFLTKFVRLFMMDPHTGFATANTIQGMQLEDMLPDQYTMTCLFIEPDPLHNGVTQAWVVCNMHIKGQIENTASRDLSAAYDKRDLTLSFTGLAQYGAGVNAFAQKIMDRIDLTGADPFYRESFIQEIDALVAARPFGYHQGIDTLAQQHIVV